MLKAMLFSFLLAAGFTAKAQNQMPSVILSDTQVVQIMVTIDESGIDFGKRGHDKAQNTEVRDFAIFMEAQHKLHKEATETIAERNSIALRDSDINKGLKDEAERAYKDLKNSDSENFDRIYMAQQVNMHQRNLDLLDSALIPNTRNADLRTHLQNTRAHIAEHLERAKALQGKLH